MHIWVYLIYVSIDICICTHMYSVNILCEIFVSILQLGSNVVF